MRGIKGFDDPTKCYETVVILPDYNEEFRHRRILAKDAFKALTQAYKEAQRQRGIVGKPIHNLRIEVNFVAEDF